MKFFNLYHLKSISFLTAFVSLSFYAKSATLTATSSTNLCQTHPFVTLVVNPANALNYTWYFYDVYGNLNQFPGTSTNTFDAYYSGNYFCQITDANGTFNTNSIMVSQAWNGQYLWQYQSPASACGVNNLFVNTNGIYFSSFQWTLNGQIIPGATTPNYAATVGGHYNCWVGNSCGADTNTYGLYMAYVSSAIPSVVNIASSVGSNVCVSTPFTLSVPAYAGASYKWYYLTSLGSPVLISTSSSNTLSMPGYNNAATYRYYCNISNACASRNTVVDTINFITSPTITLTAASANFCSGDSLNLIASTPTGGLQYQWSNNGVLISNVSNLNYYAKASGSYSVLATNGSSCSATSNTLTVTQRYKPSAVITPITATTVCDGDSVGLAANTGSGLTYQWQRFYNNILGATNSNCYLKLSGNYRVVVTNQYGCSKQSSAVPVTVNPKPSAIITAAGATSFCAGGSVLLNVNTGSGLTYNWRKNNVAISGGTSSQFSATLAGLYRCVATNSFGCSKWSNTITVSVPCRAEKITMENKIILYPNPATNAVNMKLQGEWGQDKIIRVVDVGGREVLCSLIAVSDDEIVIQGLVAGFYRVTVADGSKFISEALVVNP